MKNLIRMLSFLAVFAPTGLLAQDHSYQMKPVFHPTVDLSKHWFATGWVIANVKSGQPDNLNLFGGVGYRKSAWALEMLFQKQFSPQGNSSALDFRFTKTMAKKWSLFTEVAPSLSRPQVYDVAIVERQLTKRCSVGGETENTHRPGRDSVGGGPAASCVLANVGSSKLVTRASYQFRPNEPNVFRWYLILHVRWPKR